MKQIYKLWVYELETHVEAEVEGITYGSFGTNLLEMKSELALFTSDTKQGAIKEVIKGLKHLGHSGVLRVVN